MKYAYKQTAVISSGALVFLGVIAIVIWLLWPRPALPKAIQKQLISTAYVPAKQVTTIQAGSVKYDSSQKILSYTSIYNGSRLVYSEQPSPDIFTDVSDSFQKFMNGLNNYYTFDAAYGTVFLTRPPKNGNQQAAVMNAKGTLLFIKSERDLTNNQWRQLYNNLNIAK